MAKELEETPAEVKSGRGKKNWKTWLFVVLLLVLLGGGGGAAYYYFKSGATPETVKDETPVAAVWALDPFVVNLLDEQGTRYLKVVIKLEIKDEKTLPEFEANKARLRDAVLDLLSAKTYKELLEPAGKQLLRDELAMRINANLKQGRAQRIFFTEFVIQ